MQISMNFKHPVAIVFLFFTLAACQKDSQLTVGGVLVEPATLELGKQVYADNCAACHGVNLEGQSEWQRPNPDGTWRGPPHDESGHTWHHDDAYLLDRIRTGPASLPADMQDDSPMPAYETILSEEEIQAVLLFIKSQWPADIQAAQASR